MKAPGPERPAAASGSEPVPQAPAEIEERRPEREGGPERPAAASGAEPVPQAPAEIEERADGSGATPVDAHEWLSFGDPDEQRTWVVDVTFLLSSWRCLFGCGCQGVLTAPAPEKGEGCCSYGAHFTGEEDVARVEAVVATLTAQQWQFRARGRRSGVVKRSGSETVTRIVDGACILLNRPGFVGGAGCALHRAALDRGQRPMDTKPDVCWQLPLRREDLTADDGQVTSTVRQWDRRHWGEGGAEFAWWCTEASDAFLPEGTAGRTGGPAEPVYRTLRDELVELMGAEPYALLAAELDRRRAAGTALPHPAVRRRPPRLTGVSAVAGA